MIPTTIPLLPKLITCIIIVNSNRTGIFPLLTVLFIWSFWAKKKVSQIQSTFNSIMHTKYQTSLILCIIRAVQSSHINEQTIWNKPCHATPNFTKRYESSGHLTKMSKLNNAAHRHRRDPDQPFRRETPKAIYNAVTRLPPIRPTLAMLSLSNTDAYSVFCFFLPWKRVTNTVCTPCTQFVTYTNTQTRHMDTVLFIILYLNDPSVTKKFEKRNKYNDTQTQPMPYSCAQTE